MENPKSKQDEQAERISGRMGRIKNKILVMSGKGGVGKTTVAVNLAYAMAVSGKKTGLLDVDLHGPNVAKMLGIEGKTLAQNNGAITPFAAEHGLKVISMALLLENSDEPVIWRGPLKTGVIGQFLGDVEWGDLDYLIIDSPPGTGDEPLSICQLIKDITGAIIVTTPQDVAILDSRKAVMFARRLDVPVTGIIENMSGFTCPHCHKNINIFKKGGAEKTAQSMNIPFLGCISFNPQMVEAGDAGIPFISSSKNNFVSKEEFGKIVEKIETVMQKNKEAVTALSRNR
ncbi:MAG: Mrp/NBP35 family ATP-binding protein [Candidatus Omnitrophica bacterium]|nr:Mrp/NBP35 family ATP-binding protein [Candidatus Omnitrophota bacterium]